MASKRKPFEQYRTLLPDGRSVVGVVVYEPRAAAIWLLAESRGEALAKMRDCGAPRPHIESLNRPGHKVAQRVADDPAGGIFTEDLFPGNNPRYRSLGELREYLGELDS